MTDPRFMSVGDFFHSVYSVDSSGYAMPQLTAVSEYFEVPVESLTLEQWQQIVDIVWRTEGDVYAARLAEELTRVGVFVTLDTAMSMTVEDDNGGAPTTSVRVYGADTVGSALQWITGGSDLGFDQAVLNQPAVEVTDWSWLLGRLTKDQQWRLQNDAPSGNGDLQRAVERLRDIYATYTPLEAESGYAYPSLLAWLVADPKRMDATEVVGQIELLGTDPEEMQLVDPEEMRLGAAGLLRELWLGSEKAQQVENRQQLAISIFAQLCKEEPRVAVDVLDDIINSPYRDLAAGILNHASLNVLCQWVESHGDNPLQGAVVLRTLRSDIAAKVLGYLHHLDSHETLVLLNAIGIQSDAGMAIFHALIRLDMDTAAFWFLYGDITSQQRVDILLGLESDLAITILQHLGVVSANKVVLSLDSRKRNILDALVASEAGKKLFYSLVFLDLNVVALWAYKKNSQQIVDVLLPLGPDYAAEILRRVCWSSGTVEVVLDAFDALLASNMGVAIFPPLARTNPEVVDRWVSDSRATPDRVVAVLIELDEASAVDILYRMRKTAPDKIMAVLDVCLTSVKGTVLFRALAHSYPRMAADWAGAHADKPQLLAYVLRELEIGVAAKILHRLSVRDPNTAEAILTAVLALKPSPQAAERLINALRKENP